jgi:hypothetical protein
MPEGDLKRIEGGVDEADGKLSFNALGMLSWEKPDTRAWAFRFHAKGQQGDVSWTVAPSGLASKTPAGPVRRTLEDTTIRDAAWR